MRKSTLAVIFLGMVVIPVYFSRQILGLAGFPEFERNSRPIVGLATVVLAIVVLTILTLLNPRLLKWRQARGRDIEEEERYESDHGMISLTPKDEDEKR